MFTAKCNFNKVLKKCFLESLFRVNNYESFYKTCKNLVEGIFLNVYNHQ